MEHEKIAPLHRLTRCFCRNRLALFKCTGLVVAFRLLCFGMPISQRQRGRRITACRVQVASLVQARGKSPGKLTDGKVTIPNGVVANCPMGPNGANGISAISRWE